MYNISDKLGFIEFYESKIIELTSLVTLKENIYTMTKRVDIYFYIRDEKPETESFSYKVISKFTSEY